MTLIGYLVFAVILQSCRTYEETGEYKYGRVDRHLSSSEDQVHGDLQRVESEHILD